MPVAEQNGASSGVPTPVPPFQPPAALSRQQLQLEYVAGGNWSTYTGRIAATLPHPIDDVTRDFGDDMYDRMLQDPQVEACVTVFKASILETGPAISPAVADDGDPDYELAKEICDQAVRMISEMGGSFNDALWNLLDCCAKGNKVAEQTYRFGKAIKDGRPLLLLDKLKVKPRHATLFAVDAYGNVIGLLVRQPGQSEPIQGQIIYRDAQSTYWRLVGKEKFVIASFRPNDGDPRGTSILRPAYSPWWLKQQVIPEYLRYLSQFAGPSLVGKVAPNATPITDPNNPAATLTPQQVMYAALQAFRNGTVIAIDNGAEVQPIVMQGEGAAFLRALDRADQQITKAILTQELATEEGQHMARAAAEVHQDVLDTLVREAKLGLQDMLRSQLFRPWVILNWGDQAGHLAPIADLGATEQRDQPAKWQGAAALMNAGYFTEDQLQDMDRDLGVPIRKKRTALGWLKATAKSQPARGGPAAPEPAPQDQAEEPDPNRVVVRPHTRNKPARAEPKEEGASQP